MEERTDKMNECIEKGYLAPQFFETLTLAPKASLKQEMALPVRTSHRAGAVRIKGNVFHLLVNQMILIRIKSRAAGADIRIWSMARRNIGLTWMHDLKMGFAGSNRRFQLEPHNPLLEDDGSLTMTDTAHHNVSFTTDQELPQYVTEKDLIIYVQTDTGEEAFCFAEDPR